MLSSKWQVGEYNYSEFNKIDNATTNFTHIPHLIEKLISKVIVAQHDTYASRQLKTFQ